jgi:phosphoglycolate phosphatase
VIERLRPFASAGARGLLQAAFGVKPDDAEYKAMRQEFLDLYAECCCQETRLFPGIAELLEELKRREIRWGVVTNKSTRFTEIILDALKLKPDCVACGDTTPHLKPHPASLLHAIGQLDLPPRECCYLGDDLREVFRSVLQHAAGVRPGPGRRTPASTSEGEDEDAAPSADSRRDGASTGPLGS